jgi:predicted protein tyrosine phosphatase
MFLRAAPAQNIAGILSIRGSRQCAVEAQCAQRLDLTFDDVEVPSAGDVESLQRTIARQRWARQNGLLEVAPSSADAASIIQFARDVQGLDGVVLCHCDGGMSRAPAAALICLAVWRGPGTERGCVVEIQRLRRGAVPHLGLVRFADELLGRGGALLDAAKTARDQTN